MSESKDTARLMQGVIPYLAIDGAREAVRFYEKAFSAELVGEITTMPNDTRVANVALAINGGVLMLSDSFPEMGESAAKDVRGMTLQLIVDDGDLWWSRAVDAGCEVLTPFALQFWGDRYGQLRDPFGFTWAINEPSTENRAKAAQL